MILFFDTETTGLVDNFLPPEHEAQPHLVQLAALLTDDDGTERSSINLIINPSIAVPVGASRIHGITTDLAEKVGVTTLSAFGAFYALFAKSSLLVAHNIDFDVTVMLAAGYRSKSERLAEQIAAQPTYCTLAAATPVVNLPPTDRMLAAGFDKPKPPKLEECIRFFFDEELKGAHDALIDVRACKRVFFKLKELEQAA